ncbi:MAG: choice-of-anchor Q domain-containing protein [Wenzhouxiangella sp.]|jgi:hypothetical protein|nr:choice-of-anchor Q domain-containing protein [Wenzhouxiangella sp.]
MPRSSLIQVFFIAALLWQISDAEAATRFVDGNSGSDAGNCLSTGSPCSTIGYAINVAGTGDVIDIADAIYTEALEIDRALSLQGETRAGTIVQAAATRGQASDRTISVANDVDLQVTDLTIRHGNTGQNGGGLQSIGGDLRIERVTFVDNDADGLGAGLNSGGNVVVMTDVAFHENGSLATSNGGGAFLGVNFEPTDVTLSNVVFANNSASVGGGLDLVNSRTQASDVVFIGNSVDNNGGGLSYRGSNSVDSTLAMTNVEFIGNQAANFAGGMYTQFDTPYTLVNGLFSGNLAELGGGIYNQGGTDGERVLTNVTMSANRATRRGGAIDRPLDMGFRNTVIWNNRDESGTGTPEATMDDFFSSSIIEASNSLLQGYRANEFPGSGTLDGTNPANAPQFVTAVSPVGAPTQAGNLRLSENSPLIDAGNNGFVTGISFDLDGLTRINGGTVDLGPYETGNDELFQDRFEL